MIKALLEKGADVNIKARMENVFLGFKKWKYSNSCYKKAGAK
jgi:hypothetical protein